MRLFLDTNVLVSALTTRGLCSELLEFVVDRHELLISDHLLKELRRVLAEKFRQPAPVINGYLGFLSLHGEMVNPVQDPGISLRDPDDLPILCAAAGGKADALVTGDTELLALGKPLGLRIVSPREAWVTLGVGGTR